MTAREYDADEQYRRDHAADEYREWLEERPDPRDEYPDAEDLDRLGRELRG